MASMFSDKNVLLLSVKVLGEMFRSSSYNEVSPSDMSFEAVRFAHLLIKELKVLKHIENENK